MFRGKSETEARYSQQLQTGTGRRASFETVPPPRDRQSLGGKMSWCYGDRSRILIHGISSSTLCREQTVSAFHYTKFHNAEKTEMGAHWDFSISILSENIKKLKGGPFGEKLFSKKGLTDPKIL